MATAIKPWWEVDNKNWWENMPGFDEQGQFTGQLGMPYSELTPEQREIVDLMSMSAFQAAGSPGELGGVAPLSVGDYAPFKPPESLINTALGGLAPEDAGPFPAITTPFVPLDPTQLPPLPATTTALPFSAATPPTQNFIPGGTGLPDWLVDTINNAVGDDKDKKGGILDTLGKIWNQAQNPLQIITAIGGIIANILTQARAGELSEENLSQLKQYSALMDEFGKAYPQLLQQALTSGDQYNAMVQAFGEQYPELLRQAVSTGQTFENIYNTVLSQVPGAYFDLFKKYEGMTPQDTLAGIQALQQPLSRNLMNSIMRKIQAQLGERGLAQAPGVMTEELAQSLAPYELELLKAAQSAYFDTLGLPMKVQVPTLQAPLSLPQQSFPGPLQVPGLPGHPGFYNLPDIDISPIIQSLAASGGAGGTGTGGAGGAGGGGGISPPVVVPPTIPPVVIPPLPVPELPPVPPGTNPIPPIQFPPGPVPPFEDVTIPPGTVDVNMYDEYGNLIPSGTIAGLGAGLGTGGMVATGAPGMISGTGLAGLGTLAPAGALAGGLPLVPAGIGISIPATSLGWSAPVAGMLTPEATAAATTASSTAAAVGMGIAGQIISAAIPVLAFLALAILPGLGAGRKEANIIVPVQEDLDRNLASLNDEITQVRFSDQGWQSREQIQSYIKMLTDLQGAFGEFTAQFQRAGQGARDTMSRTINTMIGQLLDDMEPFIEASGGRLSTDELTAILELQDQGLALPEFSTSNEWRDWLTQQGYMVP